MKRVLVAGEINVDLILQGYTTFPVPGKEVLVDDFVMTLGSASAICAMGLARLGTPVGFVSRVGADPWGTYCLETMDAAGIDVSRVVKDQELKTGVTVSITSPRDRALVSFLGSIASLKEEDVADSVLPLFDHLHVSSYFLQQNLRSGCRNLFARAHAAGLTTSLDPGFDPSEGWAADIVDALLEADLFFPNEVELRGITGCAGVAEGLRRLENGRTRTVAKLGADGCMALDGGRILRQAAFAVEPLDTTGAGDSFDAGFLHAWLGGLSLAECMRWGAACGSLSTRGPGGTSCQGDRGEIERLLSAVP